MTATATREKPILFSGPMVKAILDGRKTMTRRIMKPQPEYFEQYPHWRWTTPQLRKDGLGPFAIDSGDRPGIFGKYSPGETLWVRETWGPRTEQGKPVESQHYVKYRADFIDDAPPADGMDWHTYEHKWRPSIHMPKWAARLWLEIVSVTVERVQEITEADAKAEGCVRPVIGCALDNFYKSWSEIYPGSWERNDFVWRIEFRPTPNTSRAAGRAE
jgi:hypothetical protein